MYNQSTSTATPKASQLSNALNLMSISRRTVQLIGQFNCWLTTDEQNDWHLYCKNNKAFKALAEENREQQIRHSRHLAQSMGLNHNARELTERDILSGYHVIDRLEDELFELAERWYLHNVIMPEIDAIAESMDGHESETIDRILEASPGLREKLIKVGFKGLVDPEDDTLPAKEPK